MIDPAAVPPRGLSAGPTVLPSLTLTKTAVGTLSTPKTDSASTELCLDGATSSIIVRSRGAGRQERPRTPPVLNVL